MANRYFKKRILDFQPYLPNEFEGFIKMDANESPFNIKDGVKAKIMDRIEKLDFMYYPDCNSDILRASMAEYVGVPMENIVVGNGSDEMIHVLLNTFVEMDDVVLSHNPTFTMYGLNTKVLGGQYMEIEAEEEFAIDIDKLIKKANEDNAKVVILCNPNNPTGKTTPKSDIMRLLDETDSIIVVDEAYIEFGGETVVREVLNSNRLIVLRTLSKAFGAAAIRTGYLISSEEIANKIAAIKAPYNLNCISQIVAEELLKDMKTAEENIKLIKAEKDRVFSAMENIDGVKPYSSDTNFILFKVDNAETVFQELKKRKLLIRLFKGGALENHLRVSVGTEEDNDKFIDSLSEILKGM